MGICHNHMHIFMHLYFASARTCLMSSRIYRGHVKFPIDTASKPATISKFLTRAELSISGSEVTIRCEFTDDYPEASCVLVCREYNDPYLTVEEYSRSTEFPVTISVDNTERYTFAVFGKNKVDEIEAEPVIKWKIMNHVKYIRPSTSPAPLPPSPSPSPSPSSSEIGRSLLEHCSSLL